jgi:Co/Zn/Cd efflux system component
VQELKEALYAIAGVEGVHCFHVWALTTGKVRSTLKAVCVCAVFRSTGPLHCPPLAVSLRLLV